MNGLTKFNDKTSTAWILFFIVFRDKTKIGSLRLPTHSRNAHRNFFQRTLLISKSKFWPQGTLGSKGLNKLFYFLVHSQNIEYYWPIRNGSQVHRTWRNSAVRRRSFFAFAKPRNGKITEELTGHLYGGFQPTSEREWICCCKITMRWS